MCVVGAQVRHAVSAVEKARRLQWLDFDKFDVAECALAPPPCPARSLTASPARTRQVRVLRERRKRCVLSQCCRRRPGVGARTGYAGDLNVVVPGKFIAFSGPQATNRYGAGLSSWQT